MEEYSSSNKPSLKIKKTKSGVKYYYKGATGDSAAFINDTESKVSDNLNSIDNYIVEKSVIIEKLVDDLDRQFGEKFILVNNQKLGFVDIDAYNKLIKELKSEINQTISTSNEFFSTCEDNINEINSWLKTLEQNYSDYNGAKLRYMRVQKTWNGDPESSEGYRVLQAAKDELAQYKRLPSKPTDYGDWIKK